MIPSKSFLKLNRNLLVWKHFKEPNVCHLWIYILFQANVFPKEWNGIRIKTGQFVTSLKHLSEETGLTVSQVRTALKTLTESESIKVETIKRTSGTKGYTIITIPNYEKYQMPETKQKKRGYI